MKTNFTLRRVNPRHSISIFESQEATVWDIIKAVIFLIGFAVLGALSFTPLIMGLL